ncbi:hypothetical protein [Vibrio coralliilyticus]|uniref:hypothetical protein n=1 Tax=Vibrio coralliilyticus TaxID=190893 RepID=UPI001560C621|nr:hypothetical protein [Vibrio coralliilyticus]NRF28249.1 hypothetical protein [Vibrio coralliilyticus]NRF51940.1 hypothetical protein [Vibrio coralliilyticus]
MSLEIDEYYSEKEWIRRQINISEEQLSALYGIKAKEKSQMFCSLTTTIVSALGFLFFLLVVVHPNGSMLVSNNVYMFSGVLAVFSGFIFFVFIGSYLEHQSSLREVNHYIDRQCKALKNIRDTLSVVERAVYAR